MSHILIIDDDHQLGQSFAKILKQEGYQASTAFTGQAGIDYVQQNKPDLVILDVRLPDIGGLDVFDIIHDFAPSLPVIIFTAYSSTETAIDAIRKGAYDYIFKPFDVPEILELIEKALIAGRCMSLPVESTTGNESSKALEALVGNSPPMIEIYKAIGRVAGTNATVLVRGESGTGKELVSRALYTHSLRRDKPFVVVNCVAIPESLLESELFGYEKGSFTGAEQRRVGKMEQARGGTVFFDEIGDMPLAIQAKLLRLLQENSIERLGGKEPIDVDVRVIAATNRDLESAVVQGTFREDLYYRLRVVTITLPPLRERKEDISILADFLLNKLSLEMALNNPGIAVETLEKIKENQWPGNIRELSNVLKKALIFNRGAPIQPEDIAITSQEIGDVNSPIVDIRSWIKASLQSPQSSKIFDDCVDQVSKILIEEALLATRGNRSKASKLLGISRPTLHTKIDKYCLDEDATNE